MGGCRHLFQFSKYKRFFSSDKGEAVKICIVGGGPAGFYAAQQFVKVIVQMLHVVGLLSLYLLTKVHLEVSSVQLVGR